jgi:proline iminopeptidase
MQKPLVEQVYQVQKPRAEGYLAVGQGHELYWATYGNPEGIPVVVLHGGPGAGCSDSMSRYFDPQIWNVVMFDQRGAMRSRPFGRLEENTPQRLVEDIETLRKFLKVEQWMVFGGSWGSTLALLYGQQHPERCLGFILRGIFLARGEDARDLFGNMARSFPDAYEPVRQLIPPAERDDYFMAYHRRVMDPDPAIHLKAADTLTRADFLCSTCRPNPEALEELMQTPQLSISMCRLFLHYAYHQFWLEPNQIIRRMERIAHLPCIIVHGRWDVICMPEMAYTLHQHWPGSQLWFIPDGGHSSGEPSIAAALTRATDLFAEQQAVAAR